MKEPLTKTFEFRLSDSEYDTLKRAAKKRGLSGAKLLREAIHKLGVRDDRKRTR